MRDTRYYNLDFLRGLFAVAVAIYHYEIDFLYPQGQTSEDLTFPAAYVAVDFFFVLSGFVLSLALNNTRLDLWQFVIRRLQRLYPLVFLALVTVTAILFLNDQMVPYGWLAFNGDNVWSLTTALLLLNGLGFGVVRFNYPDWSISTEMAAGLLLFLKMKYNSDAARVFAIFAAIIIYTNIAATSGQIAAAFDYHQPLYGSIGLARGIAGILIGSLIFDYLSNPNRVQVQHSIPRTALFTIAEVGVIWAIWVLITSLQQTKADFTLVALVVILVVLFVNGHGLVSRLLNNRYFGFFGSISYPLYLFHVPLLRFLFGPWLNQLFPFTSLPRAEQETLYLLLLVPAATLIHLLIERPIMRWFKKRAPTPVNG